MKRKIYLIPSIVLLLLGFLQLFFIYCSLYPVTDVTYLDEYIEDFALRVPPFHFCGTVRLTLTVPLISELWYRYRASEMNAVKRCSVTDAP